MLLALMLCFNDKMAASKALKFGHHLKELRIHLCQTSTSSKGVREFLEQNYVVLKQANPRFPILVRECSSVEPALWARYELGQESSVPLTNMTSAQVMNALQSASTKTQP